MRLRNLIPAVVVIGAVSLLIARGDGYQLYIISLVGLTTIVGIGLNILLGLTAQISLGHAAFYAIGAYTVGILTGTVGWSFWPALIAAGVIACVAGGLLAIPVLRVRGPYLAMMTIAFGFVVEQGAAEWKELTGGWNGLIGIPAPHLFGHEFSVRDIALLVLALTILAHTAYARLSGSPWGKAMRAVRDSEIASTSIGLNPTQIRTTAFAMSAFAAGIAGGVFASMSNFISPESFPFFQSIVFLLVVMVGGLDSVFGPLAGAIVVVLLPEMVSWLAEYRLLFVGLLLLIVLRIAPSGLVGLIRPWLQGSKTLRTARAIDGVSAFLRTGAGKRGLVISNLSISFGGVRAVSDLSFEARPGEITSIIGPNGAGKTTVLNLICGFYRPDEGAIRLAGQDVAGQQSYRLARAGIARTFQTSQLFDSMSVFDNIMIALRQGRLEGQTVLSSDDDAQLHAIAESLLAFVHYTGPLDQPASALAHVDKRLVEIARALAIRPGVIALDEPAAGLGAIDKAAIGTLLKKVAEVGVTVLLIEHNMDLVMDVSSHIIVLDAGAKIAEGPSEHIMRDPAVIKAYLGEKKTADRQRRQPRKPGAKTLLAARDLSAAYGAATVLSNVSLHVETGETVAVLGANGAGKSTLMRALSGLIRPVGGEIEFLQQRIERLPADRAAKLGLVLVPEGRQVFPELSVLDNLQLGGYARSAKKTDPTIENMLHRFPRLRERQYQRAGLLSGGEQQMLALARGLVAHPRVLMFDEPSLGLAPKPTQALYDMIADLRDEGITILLVDQIATLALSVSDRAYVFQSGKVKYSGIASEMQENPALMRAYLGDREPVT
jgi:branched-chain amino acid transport system ATP-binding protein